MKWLDHVGSIASIVGMCVSLYVLWREVKIKDELDALKAEEEQWHDERQR
jgi:hypothetical protein